MMELFYYTESNFLLTILVKFYWFSKKFLIVIAGIQVNYTIIKTELT